MSIRKIRSPRRLTAGFATAAALAVMFAVVATSAATAHDSAKVSAVSHAAGSTTLTILNDTGLPFDCNFNPFRVSLNGGDVQWGYVYEPLVVLNQVYKPGVGVPQQYDWLASSYKWSKNSRSVTFTIRNGVKWSDGQPLTAADVLFTFQYIKKYPALDVGGAWQTMSSIRQEGANRIVVGIKPGHIAGFGAIASNTYIAPKHIWQHITNPVSQKDPRPIGSGPFTVSSCSPQLLTYQKNPTYWQANKVKIDRIVYPNYTSNNAANHDIEGPLGSSAWGYDFVPNIQKTFIAKDPKYRHYWFPAVSNLYLTPNLTNPLLKSPLVRQAISYAINRKLISKQSENSYLPPSSQTGVIGIFPSWYDKNADAQHGYYHYNPAKAISLLQKAGFTRGSDGIFQTSAGQKLTLPIIAIGAFSDAVTGATIITNEFKAVGIDSSVDAVAGNLFDNDIAKGSFTLAYGVGSSSGVTPYAELYSVLDSANSAPIGQSALANFERWTDPATDKLFAAFGSTTNAAKQHHIMDQIEEIMLNEVPTIPVVQAVDWNEWGDKTIVGWPTAAKPYVSPCGWCTTNTPTGVILTHIRPR